MTNTYDIVTRQSKIASAKRRKRCKRREAIARIRLAAVIMATSTLVIGASFSAMKSTDTPSDTGIEAVPPLVVTEAPLEVKLDNPTAVPAPEKRRYILYDVPISEELQAYTQDVCEELDVSYPLVLAVMEKESTYRPDVVSRTNDYGIMQINKGNHKWLGEELGITDWLDPEQNILAGVYVLSQFSHFDDPHQILMSYNSGPTGAKRLWADGVYSTAYSRAVVEILARLEVIGDE